MKRTAKNERKNDGFELSRAWRRSAAALVLTCGVCVVASGCRILGSSDDDRFRRGRGEYAVDDESVVRDWETAAREAGEAGEKAKNGKTSEAATVDPASTRPVLRSAMRDDEEDAPLKRRSSARKPLSTGIPQLPERPKTFGERVKDLFTPSKKERKPAEPASRTARSTEKGSAFSRSFSNVFSFSKRGGEKFPVDPVAQYDESRFMPSFQTCERYYSPLTPNASASEQPAYSANSAQSSKLTRREGTKNASVKSAQASKSTRSGARVAADGTSSRVSGRELVYGASAKKGASSDGAAFAKSGREGSKASATGWGKTRPIGVATNETTKRAPVATVAYLNAARKQEEAIRVLEADGDRFFGWNADEERLLNAIPEVNGGNGEVGGSLTAYSSAPSPSSPVFTSVAPAGTTAAGANVGGENAGTLMVAPVLADVSARNDATIANANGESAASLAAAPVWNEGVGESLTAYSPAPKPSSPVYSSVAPSASALNGGVGEVGETGGFGGVNEDLTVAKVARILAGTPGETSGAPAPNGDGETVTVGENGTIAGNLTAAAPSETNVESPETASEPSTARETSNFASQLGEARFDWFESAVSPARPQGAANVATLELEGASTVVESVPNATNEGNETILPTRRVDLDAALANGFAFPAPVAETAQNLPTAPVAETAQDLSTSPVAEATQSLPASPVAETAQGLPTSPVVETTQDLPTSPVAETAQNLPTAPVAEATQGLTDVSSVAAPIPEVGRETQNLAAVSVDLIATLPDAAPVENAEETKIAENSETAQILPNGDGAQVPPPLPEGTNVAAATALPPTPTPVPVSTSTPTPESLEVEAPRALAAVENAGGEENGVAGPNFALAAPGLGAGEAIQEAADERKKAAVAKPLSGDEIAWVGQIKGAIRTLVAERDAKKAAGEDVRRLDARLRLLYLAIDEYDRSIQEIEDDSDPLKVFWETERGELETLLQSRLEEIDPTFVAERLQAGLDSLSGLCDLRICKSALVVAPACFGLYEERSDAFRPGETVFAYAELEYVSCRDTEDGRLIDVECRWRLLNADGSPLTPFETQRCSNLSETKLRDVVLNVSAPLPKDLAPGAYLLETEVVDMNRPDARPATERLELNVVADAAE